MSIILKCPVSSPVFKHGVTYNDCVDFMECGDVYIVKCVSASESWADICVFVYIYACARLIVMNRRGWLPPL